MTRSAPLSHGPRVTRLTNRGLSVLLAGVLTFLFGTWTGLLTVVLAGAFGILAPSLSWAHVRSSTLERGRNPLTIKRRAQPVPTMIGSPVGVEAELAPRIATARSSSRLHGLALSALSPAGLGAGRPQRAQIRAGFAALKLSYSVVPDRRGTWPLGPLFATQTDLFGFVRSQSALSDGTQIRVWARVLPITGSPVGTSNMLAPQRAGALDPSDEDALLRTYQPGDDLRRVHWASAARFSELMVRSNEGSSLPLAAVLLDLPPVPTASADRANHPGSTPGAVTEWSVTVAASIALHLIESGHATRFISSEGGLAQPGLTDDTSPTGSAWVLPRDQDFRHRILDRTIEIRVPRETSASRAGREATLTALASATRRELIICVLAEPAEGIEALVDLLQIIGPNSRRFALVTLPSAPEGVEGPEESPLVAALTAAGWHARALRVGEDLTSAWDDLIQVDR